MIRHLLVVLVAAVAVTATVQLAQEDSPPRSGCDGVQHASDVVREVESAGQVPTAERYAEAAHEVRRVAADAPAAISADLHRLADAYGELSILFRGFDPADPSTYSLIEQRTPEIEREETKVDAAAGRVATWLQGSCKA